MAPSIRWFRACEADEHQRARSVGWRSLTAAAAVSLGSVVSTAQPTGDGGDHVSERSVETGARSDADAGAVRAQLAPALMYRGARRPIPVRVEAVVPAGRELAIRLLDPLSGGATITRRRLGTQGEPASARAGDGRVTLDVDLTALMPVVWTRRGRGVLLAQLETAPIGSADAPLERSAIEQVGAPLVIEPMIARESPRDGLSHALRSAFDQRDARGLARFAGLTGDALDELRERVVTAGESEGVEPPVSGVRVYEASLVVLETDAGALVIDPMPWHAPRASWRFVHLARHGWYDGVAFHRVVPTDGAGFPFLVQSGDPTGTGLGGPGEWFDFEPSALPHDFGVVSVARRADDPNTNGSQFFVCLSREACAELDGRYTSFGALTSGARVLETIALGVLGPADEADPDSPVDRPLEPVVIERARVVPAPPFSARPRRVDEADVERDARSLLGPGSAGRAASDDQVVR